jgi:hypothetical protein
MQRKTMKHKGGLSVLLVLLVVLVLSIGLSSCKDEDPGLTMDTNLIGVWESEDFAPVFKEGNSILLTPRRVVVDVGNDKTFKIYMKVLNPLEQSNYATGPWPIFWGYVDPDSEDQTDPTSKTVVAYLDFEEARTNGTALELGSDVNGAWTPLYEFTYTIEGNTLNLSGNRTDDKDASNPYYSYGAYTKTTREAALVPGQKPQG